MQRASMVLRQSLLASLSVVLMRSGIHAQVAAIGLPFAVASGVVIASAAAAEAPTALTSTGPQDVIAESSSRLFAVLDQESAASRHNPDKTLSLIDGLLSPHFDAEYTARLVLGRHWSSASSDQRQQFAAAFYQRLLRTYVGAVAEWTATRFKLLPLHSDAGALQVIVHTQVRGLNGTVAAVDYRLHQTTEGWKIIDVIVDGISYVRSYRDDIDADVSQNGVDAATARIARREAGASARLPAESHRPR
jgi:phospholipid transport system substrate-binding protein